MSALIKKIKHFFQDKKQIKHCELKEDIIEIKEDIKQTQQYEPKEDIIEIKEDIIEEKCKIKEEPICSVCLDKLSEKNKYFNCNHSFHQNCIQPWLSNGHTCPLCRSVQIRILQNQERIKQERRRIEQERRHVEEQERLNQERLNQERLNQERLNQEPANVSYIEPSVYVVYSYPRHVTRSHHHISRERSRGCGSHRRKHSHRRKRSK